MFARLAAWLLGLSLASSVGAAAAGDPPQRVMSLNLCADQLLMVLLPPERIASITWLSRTEGDPDLLPLALRLPANHGSAEEVLAARPDLVIAGAYTTSTTRALLSRAATPLVIIQSAQDWPGIRAVTRQIASAVGETQRGEELIAAMDARLARLDATRPSRTLSVIGWGGSGNDVPGRDTLFDAILTTAGAINLGAQPQGQGSFDLEQVLLTRPQLLLRGAAYAATPALRNEVAQHRVIQRLYPRAQLIYPEALYGCGAPKAAEAAEQLRTSLGAAAAGLAE